MASATSCFAAEAIANRLRSAPHSELPTPSAFASFLRTAFERAPAGGVSYPMAWDLANDDIAGVERTALYEEACGSCP